MSIVLQLVLSVSAAAQSTQPVDGRVERKKYAMSTYVTLTNTPVRIENVDLNLPEGTLISDLDVEVADEADFSSAIYGVSASYFPLPMWEISLNGGLVSLETDAVVNASGTLNIDSPFLPTAFDVAFAPGRESEGFGYGIGTALYAPFANLRGRPVIARVGGSMAVNHSDDNRTETVNANVTVINAQRLANRDVTLALGGTYIQIEREIDSVIAFGGEELDVAFTQGIDNPWAMTTSVIAPITDKVNVSFSGTNNFDGLNSYGLRLGYRF